MKKNLILLVALPLFFLFNSLSSAEALPPKPTILQVSEKNIIVDGKKSLVFHIAQPDETFGYVGTQGQPFDVTVENKTQVPLVLHWHGIIDPNDQDGVPYVTQLPIPAGSSYHYHFKLQQAGTYWLHSHYQLQEQKLMAAPLIIHDPNELKEKEALMFIQDFTFTDPNVIYKKLRTAIQQKSMNMAKMKMPMNADVSDVKFDAYLTNHRTLKNPDIIRVTPKQTVRLRIINASASSNYYIDLGKLQGTLFAVDAEPVHPIQGSKFQIAIGNRLDIRVQIPEGENAYPILALPEGTHQQTGLILATEHAKIPALSEITTKTNPLLNENQDLTLRSTQPMIERPTQQTLVYNLQGDMTGYRWTINGQAWPYVTPFTVKAGQRIALVFNNKSAMSHPMHLHGHVFQLIEINGKKIKGRKGDTVNILPQGSVKVMLDTDNPGIWLIHCHISYHQMGGMMTMIHYEGYPEKFTTKQRVEGEKLYKTSLE